MSASRERMMSFISFEINLNTFQSQVREIFYALSLLYHLSDWSVFERARGREGRKIRIRISEMGMAQFSLEAPPNGGWNGVKIKVAEKSRYLRRNNLCGFDIDSSAKIFTPNPSSLSRSSHSWKSLVSDGKNTFKLPRSVAKFHLFLSLSMRWEGEGGSPLRRKFPLFLCISSRVTWVRKNFQTETRLEWVNFTPRYAPALSAYFTWTVIVFFFFFPRTTKINSFPPSIFPSICSNTLSVVVAKRARSSKCVFLSFILRIVWCILHSSIKINENERGRGREN